MFVQSSEEFEKKTELSEVWSFDWSSETKTAIFNFDIPAGNFFAKHGECSFKNLKSLKKNQNFQKFGFLIDLLRRRLQFSILISLPKFFSPTRWRFVQKPEEFEKKQYFQKFCFLIDILRRRLQFSILIPLPKCFSPSTVNVRSNFWRIWKKENFKKFDFLIDHLRQRLQFSNLISLLKTFSPSTVNVRSKIWRIWKNIRTFRSLVFWLIFWDEDRNYQFWHPCRKFFRQAWWMFVQKPEEIEKKNQNFQKLFLYSKCSFGQVECSFDKQVKIFPPTFKKVSL